MARVKRQTSARDKGVCGSKSLRTDARCQAQVVPFTSSKRRERVRQIQCPVMWPLGQGVIPSFWTTVLGDSPTLWCLKHRKLGACLRAIGAGAKAQQRSHGGRNPESPSQVRAARAVVRALTSVGSRPSAWKTECSPLPSQPRADQLCLASCLASCSPPGNWPVCGLVLRE